jgi:hypothetical protein
LKKETYKNLKTISTARKEKEKGKGKEKEKERKGFIVARSKR